MLKQYLCYIKYCWSKIFLNAEIYTTHFSNCHVFFKKFGSLSALQSAFVHLLLTSAEFQTNIEHNIWNIPCATICSLQTIYRYDEIQHWYPSVNCGYLARWDRYHIIGCLNIFQLSLFYRSDFILSCNSISKILLVF